MKIFISCFVLLFTISACDSSLQKEVDELKKENIALKKRLNSYDNSIVITEKNIHKYVSAMAYGSFKVKSNEKVSTSTVLYLRDLPVQVKWKEDQENQSVRQSGKIYRNIENVFPGAGIRTLSGKYTVIFPDGNEWSIPWQHQVEVE